MHDLARKCVLITGAAHGLGLDIARSFAAAGSTVLATDIDRARLEQALAMIQGPAGPAHGYVMDVASLDSIRQTRDKVQAAHGPIDILVNNAGIVFGGPFLHVPVEQHLATLRVNALGQVAVTHAFLPDLLSRPAAHLVHIASASGLIALPFATAYASSKWAVLGFSESLREELRLMKQGHVRVTAICPSYIGTGMAAGVRVPRFTRMLSSERVASLVLDAVRRDRELLLVPALVKTTPLARALLPRAWFRWLSRQLGVSTSMATWRGPDER